MQFTIIYFRRDFWVFNSQRLIGKVNREYKKLL